MLEILQRFALIERQVYRMSKAGAINNLQLRTETLEESVPDEACVRAIGLNFADMFAMQRLYSATPASSSIPVVEFAGEIVAVGKSVG